MAKTYGFMHMAATREWIANVLSTQDDWHGFAPEFTGNREELIAAVLKGPKLYPVGECDNWDNEKGCGGHPPKASS